VTVWPVNKELDLEPGVLVSKQHIALSLGRINFLLIGAKSCKLVGRLSLCSAKCMLSVVLYRAFKLSTITVKRKSEEEALIA